MWNAAGSRVASFLHHWDVVCDIPVDGFPPSGCVQASPTLLSGGRHSHLAVNGRYTAIVLVRGAIYCLGMYTLVELFGRLRGIM